MKDDHKGNAEGQGYCTKCPTGILPVRGVAMTLNMCRNCWRNAGRPNEDGTIPPSEPDCTECSTGWIPGKGTPKVLQICKNCWRGRGYPNDDGTIPARCTQCSQFLSKKRKLSWRNELCWNCMRQMYFTELRDDTDYELRTVFIGNLWGWTLPHFTCDT